VEACHDNRQLLMKLAGTSKQCHLQKMPQKKFHIVAYTVHLFQVMYIKIVLTVYTI